MEEIGDGIFVETAYDGVNVGAVRSDNGIICIDAPSYPQDARHWAAQVNRLSAKSIRYLVLTDCHGDRILNARWLNTQLIIQSAASEIIDAYDKRYPQTLIDSLCQRKPTSSREFSSGPVDRIAITFSSELSLFVRSGRAILKSMPGPSWHSSWLHFPDAGIVFTGDSVVVGVHPHLYQGTSEKWLKNLELLVGSEYKDTTLVPGRGSIAGVEVDVITAYLHQLRAEVKSCVEAGKTKEEVAARAILFMHEFPIVGLPYEWVYTQIFRGLEYIFDEMALPLPEAALSK